MILKHIPRDPVLGTKAKTEVKCDQEDCGAVWTQLRSNTLRQQKKYDRHICPECMLLIRSATSSIRLKNTKAKMTPEQRSAVSRKAGKASQATGKPSETWFSRERWDALPLNVRTERVTNANKAAMQRIEALSDEEKAAHYTKVRAGGLGFVSKGCSQLYERLADMFGSSEVYSEYQISKCCVDICFPNSKVVVEYNGDAYHCNPLMYSQDYYSSLIRMTAGQKWDLDKKRKGFLNSLGYTVIVVWERDWKNSPNDQLSKISYIVNSRLQNGA